MKTEAKRHPNLAKRNLIEIIKHSGSYQCKSTIGRSQKCQKELQGKKVLQGEDFLSGIFIKVFDESLSVKR